MRATRRLAIVFVGLSAILDGGRAVAQRADRVSIEDGASSCPTPAALIDALAVTLPSVSATIGGGGFAVRIEDQGDGFTVVAGGATRSFADPDRRCGERADKAAVFIALSLPQPPPEEHVEPPPIPVVRERALVAQLEVGNVLVGAPQDSALTGAGTLRLFLGNRFVGGVLGVSALGAATLNLSDSQARILRVPFEVGLRGRVMRGRVGLTLDATLVLGPVFLTGLDVAGGSTQKRLEIGAALTGRVEYWVKTRFAPFAQFAAEAVPTSYQLSVSGQPVGGTPQVWLSFAVGIAVRL